MPSGGPWDSGPKIPAWGVLFPVRQLRLCSGVAAAVLGAAAVFWGPELPLWTDSVIIVLPPSEKHPTSGWFQQCLTVLAKTGMFGHRETCSIT